jgi:hypothetical protein
MRGLPHLVNELSLTMIDRAGGSTRETHHAKVYHDDSVAGRGRHVGGDCADGGSRSDLATVLRGATEVSNFRDHAKEALAKDAGLSSSRANDGLH